ncbi:hypothetical protein EES43_28265 [Streptomyces sp. ADI96-02]|uniref:DUF6480 family protein n=1 Tax=unclassified Streptomyces TaxID=2593676 RepID=UPI000F54E0AA|nr:DUF6480 family protein [Streptomyces sp. ADI96-02]RPK54747.1 hypothetical protein EES43_28265 [Streptomyces sp. ADI96-02]
MAISRTTPGSRVPPGTGTPPQETPPAEGSIGDAHQERPDGGIWEHPVVWMGLIMLGALVIAGFFIGRIFGYG